MEDKVKFMSVWCPLKTQPKITSKTSSKLVKLVTQVQCASFTLGKQITDLMQSVKGDS